MRTLIRTLDGPDDLKFVPLNKSPTYLRSHPSKVDLTNLVLQ